MAEAEQVTESVLEEYRCLEARGSISQQHRDRLRQRKAALSSGTTGSIAGAPVNGTSSSSSGFRSGSGAGPAIQSFFDPQLAARPVQLFPAF